MALPEIMHSVLSKTKEVGRLGGDCYASKEDHVDRIFIVKIVTSLLFLHGQLLQAVLRMLDLMANK